MSKKLLVTLFLVALLATTAQAWEEEDNVIVLTDDNFDEVIAKHEFVLVEFYAPWCGHCKKLTPEYAAAAKVLKAGSTPVPLGKMDATEHKAVAARFTISGFPTLKFFVKGEEIEYNGGRTEKDIVAWVQKRTGSVTATITTTAEFDKFTADNKVAVVYFGKSEEDNHYAVFKTVAMGFDKLGFAHVFGHPDIAAHAGTEEGKVVLFKHFDEKRNDYEGAFKAAELKKFVDENSFATVMEFDDRAIERVFQQGNPTVFIFINDSTESKDAYAAFESVAKTHRGGKVLFSVSAPNDGHGHFDRLAEYVGVNTKKVP